MAANNRNKTNKTNKTNKASKNNKANNKIDKNMGGKTAGISTIDGQEALCAFNDFAVANKFTGIQMQLWNKLFWLVNTYGQGVCLPTYHLVETLNTSRSQLIRARNALVAAGCLRVDKVSNQRLYYTVLVNGVEIDFASSAGQFAHSISNHNQKPSANNAKSGSKTNTVLKSAADSVNRTNRTNHANHANDTNHGNHANHAKPHTHIPKQPDVILNGNYRGLVQAFVKQQEARTGQSAAVLEHKLNQWCSVRSEHGWTLTEAGFAVSMQNLLEHSGGDIAFMIKIIDRTLEERWKGFHPYSVKAQPSGALLRKQERNYTQKQQKQKRKGAIPDYDTQIIDLDFLTR